MIVDAALEAPQPATGPAFADALTFSFGDPDQDVFGIARLGLSPGAGGGPQASGLGLLFSGGMPVGVQAAGGIELAPGAGWADAAAAGVSCRTLEPLRVWEVHFAGEDGASGFDLRFEALSAPGVLGPDSPAAEAGGMVGYDQLCRVSGMARIDGAARAVSGLGQRGHSWGSPDWDRLALTRTVQAWIGEDLGLSLTAVRPRKAKHHADEKLAASLFVPGGADGNGSPPLRAATVEEAYLSTTTDAEGRQRRASVDLYEVAEDDFARRAAGEVLCGTSLDLGRLRLDCAFFVWAMGGRRGIGRYDVLRLAG